MALPVNYLRFVKSLLALAATIVCIGSATAGDAFFSTDGKTVTFVPLIRTGILWRLNVASGKLTELPLPAELKESNIDGLACGAEGEALFLAGNAVWVMVKDGSVKKVCEIGAVKNATELCVAPSHGTSVDDWLFITGTEKEEDASPIFFARKPKQKTFAEVFCRRADGVNCGSFSNDGRFFFSVSGDIWEGGFAPEDDPEMRMATLVGARIAPLGLLSTDMANAGSRSVRHLAVAGPWIYAGLAGHHMGAIVRVRMPKDSLYAPAVADPPDAKTHLNAMRDALAKTEVLVADTEGLSALCACEVGGHGRVFYREARSLWLWNEGQEPQQMADEPEE